MGCQSAADAGSRADAGATYQIPSEGEPWDGPVPAGSPVWPPQYLFHFVGFENPYSIGSVYADERYVYWGQKGDYINRVDKVLPGESEVFMHGPICYGDSLFFDGPWLYCLGLDAAMRIDRQDPTQQTALPLDWTHPSGSGLVVDEQYVYAAMPGCAAITRIDKQTLAKDVMYVDGVGFPGRGYTNLAKAGDRLVCASPVEIYVIDKWGEPATPIFPVSELFGLAVVGDNAYWLEDGGDWPVIGVSPLSGGGQSLLEDQDGGFTTRIVYIPSIGRLLWGDKEGLRTLDTSSNAVAKRLDIGNILDIGFDDAYAYASIDGVRSRTVNGRPKVVEAYWLDRVPLADLQ
jgi:hypothetical protein